MLPSARALRGEFRPMFTLAWPVVVAELGWMFMGIVDTIMVGRLSPEADHNFITTLSKIAQFTVTILTQEKGGERRVR